MGGQPGGQATLTMANISKIIFFTEYPFSERECERFGIETLRANGFEVGVWDFAEWLHPEDLALIPQRYPLSGLAPRVIRTKQEARRAIAGLAPGTFVVNLVTYAPASASLYRSLSATGRPYAVFMANALPVAPQSERRGGTLFRKLALLREVTPAMLLERLFVRCPARFLGIRPASLILAGGECSMVYRYPVGASTEILWAHMLDYDFFLREGKRTQENTVKRMCVFIDEYLPYHRDFALLDMEAPATPEAYYPAMRRLFDAVEAQLGCRVVVAAHPSSEYARHDDCFGGREIVAGKTAEFVRDAACVIGHYSTAIGFAAMYGKPVIFVTSDEIEQSRVRPFIHAFARWLGKAPLNVSRELPMNLSPELCVEEAAYQQYCRAFIKKEGTEELPFWQIFAQRMKRWE